MLRQIPPALEQAIIESKDEFMALGDKLREAIMTTVMAIMASHLEATRPHHSNEVHPPDAQVAQHASFVAAVSYVLGVVTMSEGEGNMTLARLVNTMLHKGFDDGKLLIEAPTLH